MIERRWILHSLKQSVIVPRELERPVRTYNDHSIIDMHRMLQIISETKSPKHSHFWQRWHDEKEANDPLWRFSGLSSCAKTRRLPGFRENRPILPSPPLPSPLGLLQDNSLPTYIHRIVRCLDAGRISTETIRKRLTRWQDTEIRSFFIERIQPKFIKVPMQTNTILLSRLDSTLWSSFLPCVSMTERARVSSILH